MCTFFTERRIREGETRPDEISVVQKPGTGHSDRGDPPAIGIAGHVTSHHVTFDHATTLTKTFSHEKLYKTVQA